MTTDAELIEKADALAEQFAVDKHARREIGSAILDALKRVRDEAWACGEAGIDDETATERELASMTIERLQAEAAQLRQRVADLERERYSAMPPLPPKESDGDGCQACIDGVVHISCEPYFVPAPPPVQPSAPPPNDGLLYWGDLLAKEAHK